MKPDFHKLKPDLNREEGRRACVYKDSLGFFSIAVGRLVDARKGGGLRDEEIEFMLDNDLGDYYIEIENEPWFLACDTEPRARALFDMYFELRRNLLGFKRTLAAIIAGDWEQAARRLKQSLWAKQVPKRAARIIEMIRTGQDVR